MELKNFFAVNISLFFTIINFIFFYLWKRFYISLDLNLPKNTPTYRKVETYDENPIQKFPYSSFDQIANSKITAIFPVLKL